MFLLPISLIQSIGRDAYIALAIGGGIDLITLGLFASLYDYGAATPVLWRCYCWVWISGVFSFAAAARARLNPPDVDFFELLKRAFGKVGAKIFVAFVALFLFFKLNISTTESRRKAFGRAHGGQNVGEVEPRHYDNGGEQRETQYCRCVAFVIGKNSHMPIAVGVCVALYFTQVYAMTDPTVFSHDDAAVYLLATRRRGRHKRHHKGEQE